MVRPDASVVLVPGPWTHRMVAANGARFHVAEVGEGPLVLFLHGFPECWWAWRAQLPAVAAAGYRAVAMDLRGYGASDKPPRGYDPPTLAGDVTGVIRSLGAADAVLVGHGWGGMLAWTAAVRHPRVVRRLCALSAPHPRRLRAALLADPHQLRASTQVLGFQRPWLPERQLRARDGAGVLRLLDGWSAPGWPDADAAAFYRTAIAIPGVAHCALESWRWAVRSVPRPDGMRYHRSMRTPVSAGVLHLHGDLDPAILPTSAQGSSRYVRAPYRWRLLPGVGHYPHEEAPQQLTAELLSWLADPEPER
jgi:pimeloyl-ACP methyl ester carboxylesterase